MHKTVFAFHNKLEAEAALPTSARIMNPKYFQAKFAISLLAAER